MNPPYTLRDATVADCALLAHYRVRMFVDMAALAGKPYPPDALKRVQADSAAVFMAGLGRDQFGWLIEAQGKPVCAGMVTIQTWLPHPWYPNARRAYYHSVYTEPEHRRCGLARELTEHAMSWCRTNGFKALVLHASEQGRPIYEKLGFKPGNEWRLEL